MPQEEQHMTIRTSRWMLLVGALALVASACGGDDTETTTTTTAPDDETVATTDPATMFATTSILGDLVANVAGECGDVEVIMPAGADPHDYELSSRQAAELRDADVAFAFGLGLEEGVLPALERAADDGVAVVEIAPMLDPVAFTGEHRHSDGGDDDHGHDDGDGDGHSHDDGHDDDTHDEDHGHSHEAGSPDPHVWQDPARMATAVGIIADELVEHTDCAAEEITDRADAYAAELMDLDREIEEAFAGIPEANRKLVTNHEAFGYLADRYDFEVIGTVVPGGTTLAEPSSAELAALVGVIDDAGVPAIFGENVESTRLVEVLAEEAGADIAVVELVSDSLGEPGSDADTYVGMMRTNANLVAAALGG
jgi:zinc/manganese transport system substrate-binding protein